MITQIPENEEDCGEEEMEEEEMHWTKERFAAE